ncbi:P30 protein [Mycoplasmopsis mustelae]|uniref:P30 protein n=1 Tax=Mycoplasmopsis mustelae TaxID=171289 RepID=A0A4R7UCL1_9BACT|nr:endonuclease [Mycoplasmopsis mustelae]TDV24109.1 P30 protein [Mycoplasmopsis mustelae]
MKKIFKWLTTSMTIVPLISVACNSLVEPVEDKSKSKPRTNSELPIQPIIVDPNKPKTKYVSEVDQWADANFENILEVLNSDTVKELMTNNNLKLVYDYVNKVIIKYDKNTKVNWRKLPKDRSNINVFKVTKITSEFNLVNADQPTYLSTRDSKIRANTDIDFKIENNVLILKYKIAQITAGVVSDVSTKSYLSKFNLNNLNDSKAKDPIIKPQQASEIQLPNATDTNKLVYDNTDNWYAAADGKSGMELWEVLNKIHQSHRKGILYQTPYRQLPSFYRTSDAFKDLYYEKDHSILDIYSENPNGNDPYEYQNYNSNGGSAKKEGDGTNREHLIPQSWFNKQSPMVSDPQFVWPTDIYVNAKRADYPHDDVVKVIYTSLNGSKLGKNNQNQTAFEVIDTFKGDVARSYLYFALAYHDQNISTSQPNTNVFTSVFPNIKGHFLQTYLNWITKDPIDKFDITRNQAIYKKTQIRNPFIDYPNLFENLFGLNPKPFVNKGILKDIR